MSSSKERTWILYSWNDTSCQWIKCNQLRIMLDREKSHTDNHPAMNLPIDIWAIKLVRTQSTQLWIQLWMEWNVFSLTTLHKQLRYKYLASYQRISRKKIWKRIKRSKERKYPPRSRHDQTWLGRPAQEHPFLELDSHIVQFIHLRAFTKVLDNVNQTNKREVNY